MKIQPILITAIIAAGITQAAMAQFEASPQAATIAFTGKYQVPGYTDVDGPTETLLTTIDGPDGPTKVIDGTKINAKSYKVGNKEIIEEVLSLELGEDVSPTGWSIVYQNGALTATKNGQEPISLVDIDVSALEDLQEAPFTALELTTTTTKYKAGESTATQTYSGSGTIEGPVAITYGDSEMVAYVTGSYKATTWYEDPTDKSTAEYVNIPGAVKITGLSGSQQGDNGYEVFTGSVNLAAAKATRLTK